VDRCTGTAVCVHPYRVGLPPGRYVSSDQPLPDASAARPTPSAAALVMPEDVTDLEGWLVAVLRSPTQTSCSMPSVGRSRRRVRGSLPAR
jgi:hypothetical protein